MSSNLLWPSWMPAPQQDSFSIQPEDRRLTSETEAGSIIRYQFDSDINIAECTIILNRMQSAWFETFERDILKQGSAWFDFPLWIGGEVVREKCRFKTRPKAGSLIGLHTTYSFSLYVSKRTHLPFNKCLNELFICWPPCFFVKASDLLSSSLRVLSRTKTCPIERILIQSDEMFLRVFYLLYNISSSSISSAINSSDMFSEQFLYLSNVTEQAVSDATSSSGLFDGMFSSLGDVTSQAIEDALGE